MKSYSAIQRTSVSSNLLAMSSFSWSVILNSTNILPSLVAAANRTRLSLKAVFSNEQRFSWQEELIHDLAVQYGFKYSLTSVNSQRHTTCALHLRPESDRWFPEVQFQKNCHYHDATVNHLTLLSLNRAVLHQSQVKMFGHNCGETGWPRLSISVWEKEVRWWLASWLRSCVFLLLTCTTASHAKKKKETLRMHPFTTLQNRLKGEVCMEGRHDGGRVQ